MPCRRKHRECWIKYLRINLTPIHRKYPWWFSSMRRSKSSWMRSWAKPSNLKSSASNSRRSQCRRPISLWRRPRKKQIDLMRLGLSRLSFMILWRISSHCRSFRIMLVKLWSNCPTSSIWRVKCRIYRNWRRTRVSILSWAINWWVL